jgi:hypothetical protein
MRDAYNKVVPYGTAPTEENLDKWFGTGATDCSPAQADMTKRSERFYSWYMGRIEYLVGASGFAVGSKLSLADVLIENQLAEVLEDAQAKPTVAAHRKGPFGSIEKAKAGLAKYPKLSKICSNVQSDPNFKKWIATRGIQGF